MDVKKLSKQELKDQYKSYYEMINVTECFGVKDLLMFGLLGKEIERRGLTVIEKCEVRG